MSSPPVPQVDIKLLPPPNPSISSTYSIHSHAIPPLFHAAMAIRLRVFCHEQGCSVANELDDDDVRSWHWVAYDHSTLRPLACIRLVPPPHPPHPNGFSDAMEKPYAKLTRLAVMPGNRGRGLARVLCGEALSWARRNPGQIGPGWEGSVLVHAQVGVEKVWEKFGFRTDQRLGRWDEEGIEHLGMWLQLDLGAGR